MINGVKLKKLRPIPDERGMVMELLRSDDEYRRPPDDPAIPYDWRRKEG